MYYWKIWDFFYENSKNVKSVPICKMKYINGVGFYILPSLNTGAYLL